MHYRRRIWLDFLVVLTSGGILSNPAAFLFSIFLITQSSSSCLNCPSLMSTWSLIFFAIGSPVTYRGFPCKFSESCFQRVSFSCLLRAFSLAFKVFFLLLNSFTVCHVILDCFSSTEYQILYIWFCVNSVCSFRYTLVGSLSAFLSFWVLILVGFHLLQKDAVFTSERFF